MKEIIEKFRKNLQVNNLSYSTVTNYCYYISVFLKEVDIADITTEKVADYYFTLKDKYSLSTIAISKNALRNFLEFININNIKIPKQGRKRTKLPEFITLDFLENDLLPMVETLCERALRTKTVLYFMFYSGLRVGEVASLKRDDFDLENKTLKVYSKKSKAERIIPFPKKIKDILEMYFDSEEERKGAFNITKTGIQSIFTMMKPYFENINLHSHTLRHCVSADTEILTDYGWKLYKNVRIGDKVFSYNLKRKRIELTNILHIYKYNYNGNLCNIKNRYLDSLVTKQHKNIFKISTRKQKNYRAWEDWGVWGLKTTKQLQKTKGIRQVKTLLSSKYNGKKSIGVYRAGLLGWIMTDGCITKKRKQISISQSLSANKYKCDIIENLLKNSRLKYSKKIQKPQINYFNGKKYQMVIFRILKKSENWVFKYLNMDKSPKLDKILQLKQNELKAIFIAMMLGDGARGREFCDQNPKTIELIQILCVLLGYRSGLCYSTLENKYRTYITYKDHCGILPKHITLFKYKGVVWCPSTKNKTWIARRNGKVFITGNSYATHLRKCGVPIENIQYLLGHANISSTLIYAHADNSAIIEDYYKKIK